MAERGSIRIIAGKWRHRRLQVLPSSGLRPTPDRVRETLFNWLMEDVADARCLDLFAGSGALGLEAASRGAREVVMVERDARLARQLTWHCQQLDANGVRVVHADAMQWIRTAHPPFEIVFLDPPYGQVDLTALCRRIESAGLLTERAKVYLETEIDEAGAGIPPEWQILRDGRAGRVRYHLASPGPGRAA